MVDKKQFKHLAVDPQTYKGLCEHGRFHESFNDIIKRLLIEVNEKQKRKVPQGVAARNSAPSGRDSSSVGGGSLIRTSTEQQLANEREVSVSNVVG